jgi:hypothetical protein
VLPAPLRKRLHDVIPWRPWSSVVSTDRLLLGLQNGTPAAEFAARFDDPMWPSTRVADGPHARLLRMSEQRELSDSDILASDYALLGRRCIELRGFFFWATDDGGIVEVARNFIARYRGAPAGPPRAHQSAADSPLRVAPIADSDCFQALDGHHRLALAIVKGARQAAVRQKWVPVRTPLQQLVERAAGRGHELAQPVDAPELERSWVVRRPCTDRLEKMTQLLGRQGLVASQSGYLDIGSRYGWFVAQLGAAGYAAEGVDRDAARQAVGRAAYRLNAAQLHSSDAAEFLRAGSRSWDVVSCMGLLGKTTGHGGPSHAPDLLRLLDAATKRVLFLETSQLQAQGAAGQWEDPSRLADLVRRSTGFTDVVDLGPTDSAVDAGPPGPSLIACLRA